MLVQQATTLLLAALLQHTGSGTSVECMHVYTTRLCTFPQLLSQSSLLKTKMPRAATQALLTLASHPDAEGRVQHTVQAATASAYLWSGAACFLLRISLTKKLYSATMTSLIA